MAAAGLWPGRAPETAWTFPEPIALFRPNVRIIGRSTRFIRSNRSGAARCRRHGRVSRIHAVASRCRRWLGACACRMRAAAGARSCAWLLLVARSAACSSSQPVRQGRRAARRAGRAALQRGPLSCSTTSKTQGRGQEIRRGRPPASVFGMGAQGADHVGLRLLPGRRLRRMRSPPRKRYVTLHPGSPDAAYAQYLIGSSYFDQIPDITRDQGRTEKAIAALEEVSANIRTSEYADSAKQKIEVARDQLAGKEMDDRPLLPRQARITPARSTASRSWSRSTRPRATSKRRWSA